MTSNCSHVAIAESTKIYNHDLHLAKPRRTRLSERAAGVTKLNAELEILHLAEPRRTFSSERAAVLRSLIAELKLLQRKPIDFKINILPNIEF